jgi:ATP-binding cassette subfamily A (ABC1) protein 3
MCVFLAYGNAQFVGTTTSALGTFTLLIFYGLAAVPLSYCYSYIFENHTSAQVGIAGLHFVFGFVLVIASFILDSVDTTRDTNAWLKHFYRLSPPFNLGEGLIQVSTLKYLALYRNIHNSAFDWSILGRSLVYLAGEAIAFFALTIAIEVKAFDRCMKRIRGITAVAVGDMTPPSDEDIDVVGERRRIEDNGGRMAEDDIVRIKGLRKVYGARGGTKTTTAVHNLSLGVPRSQCFGFLGINGAGKTTTLQMLTGDSEPTAGNAFINQYSILNQMEDVRREVGYCPQFDPLLVCYFYHTPLLLKMYYLTHSSIVLNTD